LALGSLSVPMIGLTGGIGSGKSTVLDLLAQCGAVVLDADDLARMAVDPGTPGLVKVLDRFGPAVQATDGSLDRRALARLVFADGQARRDLEAIVHPEVARLFAEALAPHRDTDHVVVYAVPLLVESELTRAFDVVVAVSAPEDIRVGRVAEQRGTREGDVRARVRAQATDTGREAVADLVIRNDGSLDDLRTKVDELWAQLESRR
jgi:dephospho-CoA kinase